MTRLAKVGETVICVDAKPHPGMSVLAATFLSMIKENGFYKVSWVGLSPAKIMSYQLEGIKLPDLVLGFAADRFRLPDRDWVAEMREQAERMTGTISVGDMVNL